LRKKWQSCLCFAGAIILRKQSQGSWPEIGRKNTPNKSRLCVILTEMRWCEIGKNKSSEKFVSAVNLSTLFGWVSKCPLCRQFVNKSAVVSSEAGME